MLPSWEAMKTGSMSFKIRTNEPNGLLLYNNGAPHAQVCPFLLLPRTPRWIHHIKKIVGFFSLRTTNRGITLLSNWSTVTSTCTWI